MIRWCAYCQHYQGEQEPLDDYSITHDICEPCLESGAMENPRKITLVQPAIKYFNKLQKATAKRDIPALTELMEQGLEMGINARDLTLGVVRPLIYLVRSLVELGQASLADEYRFSVAAYSVVEVFFERSRHLKHMRMHKNPEVLLVEAEGNMQVVDMHITEFHLIQSGVTTHTVMPGLPAPEILKLVEQLKPKTLAVSTSHPDQYTVISSLVEGLAWLKVEDRPQVVIGGTALRSNGTLPAEWNVVPMQDLTELASS